MDKSKTWRKSHGSGLSLAPKRSTRSSMRFPKSIQDDHDKDAEQLLEFASRSKSLPHLLRQITATTSGSAGTNVLTSALNESNGSVDLFDTSTDTVSYLEKANEPALPLQTAALPCTTPIRRKLVENNQDSPIIRQLEKEVEDLPATQPVSAFILSSVVAYVEVRSGGDNRTRLVMRELRNLGATVVESFRKNVTHVVFKDGRVSTYKIAVERQVPMVSTHWIEQCRKANKMVPEHLYPPYDLENYKNPANHKMIKRVKSFQPDYDMDREQRLMRIRKRMKPRPIPDDLKPAPLEHLFESNFDFMRRYIKTKFERHQSPGDCGLVRGLRTIAGPIDPIYNDYINRPVSPTSSEDEMNPVPLAVKLLRKFQSPLRSTSKNDVSQQSGVKLPLVLDPDAEDNSIEVAMARLFESPQSSDTDSSEIISSKMLSRPASQPKMSENHASATETVYNDSNGASPPTKRCKIAAEAVNCSILESNGMATSNAPTTPAPSQTQRAIRKLFKAPGLDDSPKLILYTSSDTEGSQSMSRDNKPLRHKKRKQQAVNSPAEMDITKCVGNAILDDPSSIRTKNARKSERKISRRSSAFFIPPKLKPAKKVSLPLDKSDVKSLPTIVCTSLIHEEVDIIKSIIQQLGGFELEENVSKRTTHVVSMNKCDRRTLNILRGIARGCWIVKKNWALKSQEAGKWVSEDEFEWVAFSPAVQQCRFERMAFSPYFRLDFFKDCGPIFVSRLSKPPRKDLLELLCLCGGKITFKAPTAKIIVGEKEGSNHSAVYVTALWILDSVQLATAKPTIDYAFQA